MPTYRYRCSGCGEEFELWQSIKDDSLLTHEDGCGGEVLKVLTAAGIVLKGSGFYKTDSRSSETERKSSDGSKPKKDGDGSSEPKPSPSERGTDTKSGDTTSSTTKPGDSKSTAGAAKPS
jgi:putative FmdB family regulatory protein